MSKFRKANANSICLGTLVSFGPYYEKTYEDVDTKALLKLRFLPNDAVNISGTRYVYEYENGILLVSATDSLNLELITEWYVMTYDLDYLALDSCESTCANRYLPTVSPSGTPTVIPTDMPSTSPTSPPTSQPTTVIRLIPCIFFI